MAASSSLPISQIQEFLDLTCEQMPQTSYSFHTQKVYMHWIRSFLLFFPETRFHIGEEGDPEMGMEKIEAFLTHVAVEKNVAATTQNQALSALLFFFREVLEQDIYTTRPATWAKQPQRLPTILSKAEVKYVLGHLSEPYLLITQLLYGSGLRLRECVRLRIRDLDVAQYDITVREEHGGIDRHTVLPRSVLMSLQHHLLQVKHLHEQDLSKGYGSASLPSSRLARKYRSAEKTWNWQYVFPSTRLSRDPGSGRFWRHHREPSGVQKAVTQAARTADLSKHVTCQTFRHSFAAHMLEDGYDIRTVQELLGQKDVKTTMHYMHTVKETKSPLDL